MQLAGSRTKPENMDALKSFALSAILTLSCVQQLCKLCHECKAIQRVISILHLKLIRSSIYDSLSRYNLTLSPILSTAGVVFISF